MHRRQFLGAAAAAVALGLIAGPALAETTLKLAHASSEDSLIQQAAVKFADEVAAKTGGSVKVKIFPNGQLGDEGPIAEGVGSGAIDIGLGGVIDAIDPKLGVLSLPFLFKDFATVHAVLDGPVGAKLLKMGGDRGYRMLGFLDSGFRNFSNNRGPIAKPEDMQGLKLRTPPNPVILETIKQLGALPQSIPFGEVYTALQSKVVDGAEPELRDFYDQKWFEVQKYLSVANYIWTPNYWFMNAAKYNGLSEAERAAIDAAVADTTKWYRDQLGGVYAKILDTVKAKGVQVNGVDTAPFIAKVGPVDEKFAKEFGKELIAEVRQAAAAAH
jgi:tripartite ATP-independent transporter DctP family solute receptor